MNGRNLLRIGGAVLLFLGTFLHPSGAHPNDPAAAFREYAADRLWVASHLTQFFGVAFITVGLLALYRSLSATGASAIARVAVVGAVANLALVAALQAVDGIALKVMVDSWVAAPPQDQAALFQATFAVRQIEIGLASFVSIVFGLTLALYGVGLTQSHAYPTWLGWLAVVAGASVFVAGIAAAYTGFSDLAMNINMSASALLLVWVVVVGALMWRRASADTMESES